MYRYVPLLNTKIVETENAFYDTKWKENQGSQDE